MQNEIWKDIPGYEGKYQVSNLGKVKSLTRYRKALNNSNSLLQGRVLKPGRAKSGYLTVALSKNAKSKTFNVHQLVAIVFLNHKPNGIKMIVDHKDNDKLNNSVENLQIITQRKNASKDQFRYNRSSDYPGVSWHKTRKKWYVSINDGYIRYNLGSFDDEYLAYLVYKNKLKELQDAKAK